MPTDRLKEIQKKLVESEGMGRWTAADYADWRGYTAWLVSEVERLSAQNGQTS